MPLLVYIWVTCACKFRALQSRGGVSAFYCKQPRDLMIAEQQLNLKSEIYLHYKTRNNFSVVCEPLNIMF